MRLASLEMWPDQPYLDNTYQPNPTTDPINAINRFIRGLSHDDSHLKQIEEIVRQAKAAGSYAQDEIAATQASLLATKKAGFAFEFIRRS